MPRTALLLLLTLFTLAGPANADEPVRMMTSTWSPYVDEQLPQQGLAVELVTHIFARAGYTLDNTLESWPLALEGVRVGRSEVLGTAWRDDARDQTFIYSEPYLMNELIVVKRREMKGRHYSFGALQDARIGLTPDYSYGVDFTELPGVEIVYEDHIIQNLRNLLNEKVDFVVGDRRVIAMQVEEQLKDRRQELEVADAEPVAQSHTLRLAGCADALVDELIGHRDRQRAAVIGGDQAEHQVHGRRAARTGHPVAVDLVDLGGGVDAGEILADAGQILPMDGAAVALEQPRARQDVAAGGQRAQAAADPLKAP